MVQPFEPIPQLRVDCLHEQNIPTIQRLFFARQSDFPDGPYELIMGEGDGTVNIESLKICNLWESQLGSRVVPNFVIHYTNHLGFLSHPNTLEYLTDDVLMNH